MKTVVVTLISAAAFATIGMAVASNSMPASDQSFSGYNPTGITISANLGYDKVSYPKNSGIPSKDLDGLSWNTDLGYQFGQYLAIQAGYTSFADVKYSGVSLDTYGVGAVIKAILPVNDEFSVFAKAGAMDMFTKAVVSTVTLAHRSRIAPAFGLGASYNITQNIALTVQGITTLAMKGPHRTGGSFTMPATYAAYAGFSYKFNV